MCPRSCSWRILLSTTVWPMCRSGAVGSRPELDAQRRAGGFASAPACSASRPAAAARRNRAATRPWPRARRREAGILARLSSARGWLGRQCVLFPQVVRRAVGILGAVTPARGAPAHFAWISPPATGIAAAIVEGRDARSLAAPMVAAPQPAAGSEPVTGHTVGNHPYRTVDGPTRHAWRSRRVAPPPAACGRGRVGVAGGYRADGVRHRADGARRRAAAAAPDHRRPSSRRALPAQLLALASYDMVLSRADQTRASDNVEACCAGSACSIRSWPPSCAPTTTRDACSKDGPASRCRPA